MARNWGAMIVREMAKAENQRRREATQLEKAQQKEQIKAHSLRLREQAADKESYVADQIKQAEQMTSDLLRSYEKYNTVVDAQVATSGIFSFDSLKEKYNEVTFKFAAKTPVKREPVIEVPHPEPVPNENWLENFFSSKREKRLSIIAQNQKHIEEINAQNQHNTALAESEYQKQLSDYETRKSEAEIRWEKSEQIKKEIVENQNTELEMWQNAYISGEYEAIISYINTLFATYNYAFGTIVEHQIGYNGNSKKLVVDLHIADKEEIFEAEGYKYIKQRDEFDPIKMKVTSLNERMRNLMTEVCIATFHLLFRNDIGDHLNTIVVNVFYNQICCVSAEVDRDVFLKHDFTTRSGKAAFLQLQMRIYKQITSGVKPYDTLFSALD